MKYLSVADAANRLAVSRSVIYKAIRKGELPAYRIGGLRISTGDLTDWVASRKVEPEGANGRVGLRPQPGNRINFAAAVGGQGASRGRHLQKG